MTTTDQEIMTEAEIERLEQKHKRLIQAHGACLRAEYALRDLSVEIGYARKASLLSAELADLKERTIGEAESLQVLIYQAKSQLRFPF